MKKNKPRIRPAWDAHADMKQGDHHYHGGGIILMLFLLFICQFFTP